MSGIRPFTLRDFLLESNRIEGIAGVKESLIKAADRFLSRDRLTIQDMVDFVAVAQPNAVLRDQPHLNVRVGSHIAPRGGIKVVEALDAILVRANGHADAHQVHVAYETLHPFTDGNGRSGRMLWLWMMGGIERVPIGFLHCFYYQTLERSPLRFQNP